MPFPSTPEIGETHEAFNRTWTFNGSGWSAHRLISCQAWWDGQQPVDLAPTLVQYVQATALYQPTETGRNSLTSSGMNTTTGNSILVFGVQQNASARTFTDNMGNTYTPVMVDQQFPGTEYTDLRIYAYLATGIIGGEGHTFTVEATNSYSTFVAMEIAGSTAVEDSASSFGEEVPFEISVDTTTPSLVLAMLQSYDRESHPLDAPFELVTDIGHPAIKTYWTMAVAQLRQAAAGTATVSWPLDDTYEGAQIIVALR